MEIQQNSPVNLSIKRLMKPVTLSILELQTSSTESVRVRHERRGTTTYAGTMERARELVLAANRVWFGHEQQGWCALRLGLGAGGVRCAHLREDGK